MKKKTVASRAPAQTAVVSALNQLLADSYALMANTHFTHWNVEGPDFFALHTAFQTQYEELFAAIDVIAERIRALDAYAIGGLRNFADAAGLAEFSSPASAKDYVTKLLVAHDKTHRDACTLRDAAESSDDLVSQDLANERIQWHQKTMWMLKSYLK